MRLYLTGLTTLLLLSGCGSSPDVPLTSKLSQYATAQQQCNDYLEGKETLTNKVEGECKQFIKRLDKANTTAIKLDNDRLKKNELKETKIVYARQKNKLSQQYAVLSSTIKDATLAVIKKDDVEAFKKGIAFPGNTFIKPYFDYMTTKAPMFDDNPKYLAFKREYSKELMLKAEHSLKQGKQTKALNYFEQAADLGNAKAAYETGKLYEKNDVKKAIKWYIIATENGETHAYYDLGQLYKAQGDKKASLLAFQKAAKENDAKAQYQLYLQLKESKPQEALSWLKKSANNSNPQAQYAYALLEIEKGNSDKAIDLLQQASQNNYTKATVYLGNYYYKLKFYGRAFKLLKQVDSADSFYLLAKMYEEGAGTPKDLSTAHILYSRANALGKPEAKADMQRVGLQLDQEQKKQAEQEKAAYEKRMASMVKQCGLIPTAKIIKKRGKLVHLTGVVSAPVGRRSVIIYGDDGEDYYLLNARGMQENEHVDIATKATGITASVSSADDEEESDVYQFKYLKKCVLEEEQ